MEEKWEIAKQRERREKPVHADRETSEGTEGRGYGDSLIGPIYHRRGTEGSGQREKTEEKVGLSCGFQRYRFVHLSKSVHYCFFFFLKSHSHITDSLLRACLGYIFNFICFFVLLLSCPPCRRSEKKTPESGESYRYRCPTRYGPKLPCRCNIASSPMIFDCMVKGLGKCFGPFVICL